MIQYRHYNSIKTTDTNFFSRILIGVCISVVSFVVYTRWMTSDNSELHVGNVLTAIENIDMRYSYFVLKQRIWDIFLVLLGTSLLGHKRTSNVGAVLVGLLSGYLFCLCVTKYFLKGLVLYFAFQFPQIICYVFALFLWGKMEQVYPISFSEAGYNKTYYFKKIVQYIIILLLIIAGFLLECYVNTEIMEKVIKILKYE